MKIASFNINGINGRLPVLLRWLAQAEPDVVCLQELKAPSDRFPIRALRAAGYGAVWHGQARWNGVAILARDTEPVETRRHLDGDTEDAPARYIEAAVRGILVGCLYAPNGNPAPGPKWDAKLDWYERFRIHAAGLVAAGVPVILVGDYNVMPTDLDVYNPARWEGDALFRPEVREAFRALLDQGWIDAVRALHPDERIYTFWDYLRHAWERNAGLRLDHCLIAPVLKDRLRAAGVDREVRGWERTSDHAPVWITLAPPKKPARKTRKEAP